MDPSVPFVQKFVNVVRFAHEPRCGPVSEPAATPAAEPAKRLPPAESVESLGAGLAAGGVPLLPARVFAALLSTEDGRLTAAELVDLLHVSPASVSSAVRYLSQLRMIRRERERGSRRDVYVVMDDAWHDMLMQRDRLYAPIISALATARDAVGEGTRAGERLSLSVEFLEFVLRETEGAARRWEEYKTTRLT
jgi:DNA-binding transcriptional regulator GbsR (MarR family)